MLCSWVRRVSVFFEFFCLSLEDLCRKRVLKINFIVLSHIKIKYFLFNGTNVFDIIFKYATRISVGSFSRWVFDIFMHLLNYFDAKEVLVKYREVRPVKTKKALFFFFFFIFNSARYRNGMMRPVVEEEGMNERKRRLNWIRRRWPVSVAASHAFIENAYLING